MNIKSNNSKNENDRNTLNFGARGLFYIDEYDKAYDNTQKNRKFSSQNESV
jgi:hypothetical protein